MLPVELYSLQVKLSGDCFMKTSALNVSKVALTDQAFSKKKNVANERIYYSSNFSISVSLKGNSKVFPYCGRARCTKR
jgi:hypothetical protein